MGDGEDDDDDDEDIDDFAAKIRAAMSGAGGRKGGVVDDVLDKQDDVNLKAEMNKQRIAGKNDSKKSNTNSKVTEVQPGDDDDDEEDGESADGEDVNDSDTAAKASDKSER